MPTCQNCGSYIPLGDHSCCCGTTIRYDVEDDEERRYDEAVEYRRRRQRYLERIQNENPYDEDFFNELHHRDVSVMLIKKMNDQLSDLKNRFNASLDHVDVGVIWQYLLLRFRRNTLTPLSRQAMTCQVHSTG